MTTHHLTKSSATGHLLKRADGHLAFGCRQPAICYAAAVAANLNAVVTVNNGPQCGVFIAGPYLCIGGESLTNQCKWRFYYATPSPYVDFLLFITRNLEAGVWKWYAQLGVADPYHETCPNPLTALPDSFIYSNQASPLAEPGAMAVVSGLPAGSIAAPLTATSGTAFSYHGYCLNSSITVTM